MNDNRPDRCCPPEETWASVDEMAAGALNGTIGGSILAQFIDHALGVGPCLMLKMAEALERRSAIMSEPSLRRELTYGVPECSLLTWAENMIALALVLNEPRPDAAVELAEILDDWLRLLQGWETAPRLQREPKPHFSQERSAILSCQDCGPVAPRLAWKEMEDGRAHLGAYCCRCDRWLKWVSQVDKWLRAAPAKKTAWREAA